MFNISKRSLSLLPETPPQTPKSSLGISLLPAKRSRKNSNAIPEFSDFKPFLAHLPECYHPAFRKNLQSATSSKDTLIIYYDGILDSFDEHHRKSLLELKTRIPNAEIVVGVCLDMNVEQDSKGGIQMVEQLNKVDIIDRVIYPAPWFANEKFVEDNGVDFVAQDASPILTVRDYDCYKEVKAAGKFLPVKMKGLKRVTEHVERIISHKEMLTQRCLKSGKVNLEFDITRKVMIKMRIKKLIDRLFCKNKQIYV
jgi:glycerol-3-phosphate cytidylyltransferase-like family protein